ncbi:PT domain-containing protein [Lysobacter sp. TAF61]|uniref:PT domain-containing protein n=1 Tax=Lysobacter sp. TAF61 TaxID=3233072 RepID=UPI003F99C23B
MIGTASKRKERLFKGLAWVCASGLFLIAAYVYAQPHSRVIKAVPVIQVSTAFPDAPDVGSSTKASVPQGSQEQGEQAPPAERPVARPAAQPTAQPTAQPAAQRTAQPAAELVSSADTIAAMSGLYQAIIAILIALLGLLAVFSVLSLRFLSRNAAEEIAHGAASAAVEAAMASHKFYQLVDDAVGQEIAASNFASLADRLSRLEQLLASEQIREERKGQESVPETTVVAPAKKDHE